MEEPKALLPNGHSDKPEQMEVDEVEPKMKDDVKPEPKRTKSTDSVAASDESSESIVKNKTSESSEETNRAGSENDEKSASKKKVPQKIVKRSPRISRNKEPPEKDNEARRSRSEDKDVEKKNDDKPAKLPSIEEENVSKEETDEVKKEQKADKEKEKEEDEEEEVVEVAASEEKAESATIKETEKNDEDSNKEKEKEIQFTGDPDADFLGFDDPTETKYTSYRDKFQRMIDELTASTPGPSRSRRSVLKNVETDQVKASTSGISNVKKEPELEGEAAEDDSRSRRSRSSVGQTDRKPSPVVKRNYDVTLPQYMKPFEYGWKRELSYRNNAADSVSKRMADIFYYTPLGKKIRSIGQVRDYLLGTDLTLENFTFVTKAMNLNDPSKETIRDPRKKVVEETPPPPPPATRRSLTASKTPKPVNSVESAVDKAEESATSTTPSLKAASSSTATTPKISLKSFRPPPKNKAKPPVPEKKVKKANEDSESEKEELEMGMLPPLWKSPIQSDWSANGSTTMEDISTSATKSGGGGGCGEVAASGEDGKVEVCSIRCPRMVGEVPTLACVLCLCLFHPECVAVRRNNYLSYVCKNCKDANKPSSKKPSLTVNHGSPPPLVPINPSKTDTGQSETSPSLHPSSSSPAAAPQLQRLLDCKLPAKTVQQPAKIVGGVTTWLPPSSMIQLTSKSTTTSKMSATPQMMAATVDSSSSVNAMPAQTLWQMNGKRFLYVPKHNVLSVSPAATSTSSDTHNQTAVNTLTTAATNSGGNSVLVSPGSVTMPPIIQNSVPSSFLASSLIAASGGGNSATTPTMSHALIVSSDTKNPNSNSPAGVLLVPCITTSSATGSSSMPPGGASDSSSGGGTQQKFLLVNGPATGNFLIGNLPAAVPTTQPAVPSNEAEKGIKRQLEPVDSESPPAKRTKKTANDEQQSPAPAEAGKPAEATPPPATVTPTLAPPPQQQQPPPSSSVSVNKDYFMTNVSAIYHALLNSFQYLKVQELLRAARVCHMWRDVAMNRSLWHVVRMKNSRVRDWDGLANTLRMTGARHLDMRKMLMPDKSDDVNDMWTKYAAAVDRVNSLWRIDLCRCPASAVERSARANARLQYLSALAIKSSSLDSSAFENCKNLTELRLKSSEKNGLDLQNLSSMKHLTKMKHLSLTTMKSFMGGLAEALENMKDLETLELGECSELTESVATKALPKLKRLQRLRLEKGQGPACPTIAILESVKDLKNLVQLELINFDIKSGFDTTISKCTNLRTLLIIPTYVTQSATTNHLVMEGVSKLSKTLTLFVWGITLELLRVTDLFIDQWEGQKGAVKSSAAKKGHKGDSIPILKPLAEAGTKEVGAPSQVDILQLPKLHKVLTSLLPTTKVKILKVPFSATWRQTVSGPAHIH